MRRIRGICLSSYCLVVAGLSAPTSAQDLAGSSDHPLISRYPGTQIEEYSSKEFDEFLLPLGQIRANEKEYTKSQRIEGKVTKLKYTIPANRSSLEVLRSYQNALQRAGFQPLYACVGQECGAPLSPNEIPTPSGFWCLSCKDPTRYIAAKLTRASGDIYVALDVLNDSSHGGTWLTVVEVKPMEAGLITVKSAETLNTDIGTTGHSAIYGVYFDTGKAIVKPESDPTLAEIVKLLNADPAMRLHVVGHTDNTGTFALNLTLSKQRADAVVAALVGRYRIPAARLDAAGVGSLSPVATNRNEEGRAKNRRVELVEQ